MPALDNWLHSGLYPYPKQLASTADVRQYTRKARADLLKQLAVCGDGDACVAAILRFAAAGADTIALAAPAEGFLPQLGAFAEEVITRVRK
jgi:hypothetical protein